MSRRKKLECVAEGNALELIQHLGVKQLSMVTGLTQAQWSNYLRDKMSPSVATIKKLAECFDTQPSRVLEAIEQRRALRATTKNRRNSAKECDGKKSN